MSMVYDDGTVRYILETDKGGDEWHSVFRSQDLDKVREVRREREQKGGPKEKTFIE